MACQDDETLSNNPMFPADVFTVCLTTPLCIELVLFARNSPSRRGTARLSTKSGVDQQLPDAPRRSQLDLHRHHRHGCVLSSKALLHALPSGCVRRVALPQHLGSERHSVLNYTTTFPALHNATDNSLWGSGTARSSPSSYSSAPDHHHFICDVFVTFELFLVSNTAQRRRKTEQLPVILRTLLSQELRFSGVRLLVAFICLGGLVCKQVLATGLFLYLQKPLTQTTAPETHPLLVHCWMHILMADQTRPFDQLLRPNWQFLYFVSVICNAVLAPNGPTTKEALFVLTVMGWDNAATKHEPVRGQVPTSSPWC